MDHGKLRRQAAELVLHANTVRCGSWRHRVWGSIPKTGRLPRGPEGNSSPSAGDPRLESRPTVTNHRTGGKERRGLGGLPARPLDLSPDNLTLTPPGPTTREPPGAEEEEGGETGRPLWQLGGAGDPGCVGVWKQLTCHSRYQGCSRPVFQRLQGRQRDGIARRNKPEGLAPR